jgi:very-short-patch-repair endonuclease
MLIVELDGGQHEDQRARDAARTQWLDGQGFHVLRFSDYAALMETEAVLTEIENRLYGEGTKQSKSTTIVHIRRLLFPDGGKC